MLITDWECTNKLNETVCERTVGQFKEIQWIGPDGTALSAELFLRAEYAQIQRIGWPKYFPIFNKRMVGIFHIPVEKPRTTEKGRGG